jgi:dolichyl-phosphate-mannose-protein mannosyltransferase
MALAVVLTGTWRRGSASRIAATAYTLAVIATLAWFFPLYTTIPLSSEQFDLRIWLPSWR